MTIRHHPTHETLAAFASGTLDEARAVVVASHVSLCAHCRNAMRAFEEIGGALLDRAEPVAMKPDALEHALGRIAPGAVHRAGPDVVSPDQELPAPLAPYDLGKWRWVGPGVQWRSVGVPSSDGVHVFMLKAAPGTRLPHHRHAGTEWTCVIRGAFQHDGGVYGAGDFDEADESVEHKPTVRDGETCICLVALQGQIQLQSWLGRMLQPLVRL